MKTYLEAYGERLERNQTALLKLADKVLATNPEIEIYHNSNASDRFIQGLVFFNGENINSIHFHEVPYRWSGCGYGEFNRSHSGGENVSMPFDVQDVLTTFRPVTSVNHTHSTTFKTKDQYLKWCSYLVRYEPNKEFELRHKEELIFTGSENDCYFKLQRVQSQSADWAMKYEGYTITPKIQ